MPVASTLDLVTAGRDAGYAVPAVNIVDELSIRAVVAAAEDTNSPVILQTSVKTVRSIGADLLQTMVRASAEPARVPVSLHLDHCPDRGVISETIAAGWSSVLFDASDRELGKAWQETAEVVLEAHAAGAAVECEIENITGVEDGVGSAHAVEPYADDALATFARDTGSDMLAPALGTAHGLYKDAPVLRPDRVRELRRLTDMPIVLHGGTGLSEEDFRAFIEAGVSKINISTALKRSYMQASLDHLLEAQRIDKWEPLRMFDQVFAAVRDEIAVHARMFGSAGKAATRLAGE